MNKIFLVKDENEDTIPKSFLGIYKIKENALNHVELLKLKAINKNKNLIYHKEYLMTDDTHNPTKVFLVFNQLLSRKKRLVSIHYSAFNAGQVVQALRNQLTDEKKKDIFMKIIPLSD